MGCTGTEKVLDEITSELQETTDVVEPGMIAAMLDIGCVDIDGKILLGEVISESWEYRDGVKPGVTSVILVSGLADNEQILSVLDEAELLQ